MSEHPGCPRLSCRNGVLIAWVRLMLKTHRSRALLTNLLARSDFRFKTPTYFIQNPKGGGGIPSRGLSSIPASSTSRRTAAATRHKTARSSYSVSLDTLRLEGLFQGLNMANRKSWLCLPLRFRRTRFFAQSTPYPTVTDHDPASGSRDWLMSGGHTRVRLQSLTQITPSNVGRLSLAWSSIRSGRGP